MPASTNSPSTPTSATSTAAPTAAPPAAPRKPPAVTRRTGSDADTSTTTATVSAGTAASAPQTKVSLSELQSFLSGLGDLSAAGSAAGRNRSVDLSSAINTEAVNTIASDSDRSNALLAHLPTTGTNENAKQQLKDTISSPQFQQALSMFSSALQSGQLGPVVSQFELNAEAVAAANTGDLEQFVKALEKDAERIAGGGKKKDEKDNDKETPMEEDKNA